MKSRLAILLALIFALCAPAQGADPSASAPAKRRPTPLESYVMVDPLTVTIMHNRVARGLLVVEFGIDVPDEALREKLESSMPLLRDAYVRSLSVYAQTALKPNRQPDAGAIGNRLQSVTDYVLGKNGAHVLLMVVIARAAD